MRSSEKPITQKDIAKRLGVHWTTVSMALRGVASIPPDTRQRVMNAANEMGYVPNAMARSLRRGASSLIGVIAPMHFNEIMGNRLSTLARLAQERNYQMVLMFPKLDEANLGATIAAFNSHHVAGVILAAAGESAMPPILERFLKQDTPHVLMRSWSPFSSNVVDTDRKEGWRQAVHFLAGLGHRRIGLYGLMDNPHSPSVQQRLEGWRQGTRECGLPATDDLLVHGSESDDEATARAAARVAADPNRPTAVIASSDEAAVLFIRHLLRAGVKVPQDMSIVGFDDAFCARANPLSLTTMAQPIEQLSRITIDKFLAITGGVEDPLFESVLVPPRLVVRESTAPPTKR